MLVIEYGSAAFEKATWKAIDQHQPVQLVVRDRGKSRVKDALIAYRKYFDGRRAGRKSLLMLFKFGYFAIRMPTFWGIYNHAELANAQIVADEQGDVLLVSFFPSGFTTDKAAIH